VLFSCHSFHSLDWTKHVLIKSISPNSCFFGTSLRVGQEIVSVNGIDLSNASLEEIQKLLEDAHGSPTGMTILCQQPRHLLPGDVFTVVMNKTTSKDKLGIGLGTENGKTTIKSLKDGSLSALTTLERGMFVLSVNNTPCAEDRQVATRIISEATGPLVMLVQKPGPKTYDSAEDHLLTAFMTKANKSDKVGFTITSRDGSLFVAKIFHNTLAAETGILKTGQRILKINNIDAVKLGLSEAQKIMESQDTLTFLVEKPHLAPGRYIAACFTCADTLGLRIAETDNRDMPYMISNITDGGLTSATDLQSGMMLVSVNNIDVTDMKFEEVKSALQTKERPLNVLAVTAGENTIPHTKLVTSFVSLVKGSVEKGSLKFNSSTGAITITEVGAKGCFHGTPLRYGQRIYSLNNIPAEQFTATSLRTYLNNQDFLIVVAKKRGLKTGMIYTDRVYRGNLTIPLGIGVKKFRDKLFISSIRDGTLAAGTRLQPGMEICSINNEECRGMEKGDFANFVRQTVGDIVIVASTMKKSFLDNSADPSLVTACFDMTGDTKVGLSMVKNGQDLVITKISAHSLAADSDLKVGHVIQQINNEDVANLTVEEAKAHFAENGSLTILAKRPFIEPGSLVTASIVKESASASAGIRLGKNDSDLVSIQHIVPLSAASFTDLMPGMIVEEVNGVSCKKMPLKEVNALFAKSASIVTVLARATSGVAVGRASFVSSRSLISGRSVSSRRSSDASVASKESRESAASSTASKGSDPVLMKATVASSAPATSTTANRRKHLDTDPAMMDVARATSTTKRSVNSVPALQRIVADDDGYWC